MISLVCGSYIAAPCTQASQALVEVASAESVSKGWRVMAGTPDPGAFVHLVLYTGIVHIFYNNFAML